MDGAANRFQKRKRYLVQEKSGTSFALRLVHTVRFICLRRRFFKIFSVRFKAVCSHGAMTVDAFAKLENFVLLSKVS